MHMKEYVSVCRCEEKMMMMMWMCVYISEYLVFAFYWA